MKTFHIFETNVPENIRSEYLSSNDFLEDLVLQNVRKGKLLSIIVIILEVIYASIALISYFFDASQTFSYCFYLSMYLFMIVVNIVYLRIINSYIRKRIQTNTMHAITLLFITMIMIWGCVISLMDQKLYGHIIAFMINVMICSIMYYMDWKRMLIPILTSTTLLVIALPFFQNSSNILIGHYVNIVVFITISWATSRIIYRNYCDNYIINKQMNQANLLLGKEMQRNTIINKQLEIVNAQLKEMVLMDEMTGISNRRRFREFIDDGLKNNDSSNIISIIIMDVDYFKQFNDFYGHVKGDAALILIADCLKKSIINTDNIVVRWGGEEFIYAAFSINQEDIIVIANSIRQRVLELKIPTHSSTVNQYLTISMGSCTANISNAKDVDAIIDKADKALYQAKKNGRNCVATCSPDEVILRIDEDGKLE